MEKNPKQLYLFDKPKTDWEKHGFKTRAEWLKAKAFDRAFKHFEQSNQRGIKEGAKKNET